jgi:hypothetical protein
VGSKTQPGQQAHAALARGGYIATDTVHVELGGRTIAVPNDVGVRRVSACLAIRCQVE